MRASDPRKPLTRVKSSPGEVSTAASRDTEIRAMAEGFDPSLLGALVLTAGLAWALVVLGVRRDQLELRRDPLFAAIHALTVPGEAFNARTPPPRKGAP